MTAEPVLVLLEEEEPGLAPEHPEARRAAAARWADQAWGEREGYFHFALGVGGHFGNGKYRFEHWHERHGRWPDDRVRFLDEAIEKASECDVYVAPNLRSSPSRKKGSALPSTLIYADLDELTPGIEGFEQALIGPGGFLVNSGTGRHIYLRLPEELEPAALEEWNRRLAATLGADAGWAENKVLRLPGTFNRKGLAKGGDSVLVRFVDFHPAPKDWTLTELDGLLAEIPSLSVNGNGATVVPALPAVIPLGIQARLGEEPGGDRSGQVYGFVGNCLRDGLSEAETLAVALDYPPAIEKYGRRAETEIRRAIEKHRRANSSAVTSGEAQRPEPRRFELTPVDWGPILEHGVPELEYVARPYLPARKRIWAVGAAEAGKSIWAAWQAARVTRAGLIVVYVSQENGLEEESRRFVRLRPDFSKLRVYVDQGLDLAISTHVGALIEASEGAALTVVDTLSACWSGDEDNNPAITAFDRDVLLPLIRETGSSPLVLDHTGNPQPFVRRRGVSAPRGASAKGQKADHLLEFRTTGESEFTIDHGKARGARKESPRTFRVVDTDDGALDLIEVESSADEKAAALADQLAEIILEAGELTTKKLREAAKALHAGTELQTAAMHLLEAEDPPRVTVAFDVVDTGSGRQRAKVWRPAEASPASPASLFEEGA